MDEAGKAAPFTEMMEEEMFSKSQLPWSKDPLALTLTGVSIGASIALYFIVARGWSW